MKILYKLAKCACMCMAFSLNTYTRKHTQIHLKKSWITKKIS